MNEAANSSRVGAASTSGSIAPSPTCGFVPPRSWMNAKTPSGSTISSTGTRASSGRSSRDARRRSSITVRETAGAESASRTRAPTIATATPSQRAPSLSRAGNTTPGSCLPLKRPASRARPRPSSSPSGYATTAYRTACAPCAASRVARREAPAVQHGELEGLPGERERADARQHGERDGADLEHHQQDRHAQVLHALVDEVEQRLETAHDPVDESSGAARTVSSIRAAPPARARPPRREGREGEVGVPGVLGRQAEPGGRVEVRLAIDERRRRIGGIGRRERAPPAVPERVVAVGGVERARDSERRGLVVRPDDLDAVARLDLEAGRDARGQRDLARSRWLALDHQVLRGAVAEEQWHRRTVDPAKPHRAEPLPHDGLDRHGSSAGS